MARAIQIVVVAALISAWIWVFRRPLITGVLALSGRLPEHDPLNRHQPRPDVSLARQVRDGLVQWPLIGAWLQRPLVVRRRQLLLANLFATFASFLLAIALRGRWVQLLGLMLMVLVVHLAVAAHKGGRIVEARQRSQLEVARRQARPAGTMTIRASRARADLDQLGQLGQGQRRILADDVPVAAPTSGAEVEVSLKPASPLPELEVSSLVEELIEQEWGLPSADTNADTRSPAAPTTHEAGPVDGAAGTQQADQRAAQAETVSTGQAIEPAPAEPEPIFTKAASQTSGRVRRRPRPIYIHSHLDDDDGFTPPKAVNHP